ncbi:MAG: hypothetical protein H5U24_13935, partial [Thioclava marina]|nr:hypothetical protein [Thioclava marina]
MIRATLLSLAFAVTALPTLAQEATAPATPAPAPEQIVAGLSRDNIGITTSF